MSHTHKLSLSAVVLISLNVMVGTGLFVNTTILPHYTGPYGALVYLLIGALMLPLVMSFAQLLNVYEGGGFFDYAAPIHPLAGFVSSFGYFIAKLGSCALGIHVFVVFMQQAFPILRVFPPLVPDLVIIMIFVILNMLRVRTSQSIQYGFLTLKAIPIIFVITSGLYLFQGSYFHTESIPLNGIMASVPLALFAFTGFEAVCSLAKNIENPQRNASRAILTAYLCGVSIVVLYQFLFYAALGNSLEHMSGYADAFPALVNKLFSHAPAVQRFLNTFFPIGIASSALGAAYGIMFSNAWNLFQLVDGNHIPFSGYLKKLNKNHVPFLIFIIEGMIVAAYELLSCGNQVPLQQITSLGMTITYMLSICALIFYQKKYLKKIQILPLLGLSSCVLLLLSFFRNAAFYGIVPPVIFLVILVVGSIVFLAHRRCTSRMIEVNRHSNT